MHTYGKALVLGAGCSGLAAAKLLQAEGTEILILEEKTCDFPSFTSQLLNFSPEIAIISPGFSVKHSWIKEIVARELPFLSELELGWSRCHCPVIAVTGSNGKSTVVKWIAEALARSGQTAIPCGNYGFPVSAAVMQPEIPDWLVIEVSSFQLETIVHFKPDIGLLLNILPNHLDRHGDMATYRGLKWRLFERSVGTAIVPFNSRIHEALAASDSSGVEPPAHLKTFGLEDGADYRFVDGHVGEVDLTGTYFDNEVLGVAGAAVVAVCEASGLSIDTVESSASAFKSLPHRMETVAKINGVTFIDDSKATNLVGMCAALRISPGRIHLIAGGRAKETDLSFAKDLLAQQVSRLYLIGEASEAMQAAWGNEVPCLPCGTMKEAVSLAWDHTVPGDTVLLSPACASFDQFKNFNERGEVFVREVLHLK